MAAQKDFLLPKHKQLLSIAIWAKYLSWVVLVIYLFDAASAFMQQQEFYMNNVLFNGTPREFVSFLTDNPVYGLNVITNILRVAFTGIVYFLVLKSVELGLNIIVETDINYRDKKGVQNEE